MLKLRHLCMEHCDPPDPIKEHLHWEIQEEIKKLFEKKVNLQNSLDHLLNLRTKQHTVLEKSILKRIFKLENYIETFIFDIWSSCEDENEEIWREYFFVLYEFMFTEKFTIDMSNITTLEHSIMIYENLKRPVLPRNPHVRLIEYKFHELYTIYKSIVKPDTCKCANETLSKKIEMTNEIIKLRKKIQNIENNITRLDNLLPK